MNICFVGLGSIAKRHIKNINELWPDIKIDVLRHSNTKEVPEEIKPLIRNVYTDSHQLPKYDAVFITNPTAMHYETLADLVEISDNFFIEKPVFETGNEDIASLGLKTGGAYYVACPLRYTNVITYLKEKIDFKDVYSVRAISSSYLPDWRPGTDYRDTYSAKKALGGGVSIDLIHEWDYLRYLLGEPQKVRSIISKKSDLEIDSDDLAVYIAEYKNCTVELHLDYLGRVPVRKIELFGKTDTIEADLIEQKVTYKKAGIAVNLFEERDSYQRKELAHFFSIVRGEVPNDNTIEEACMTLKIARGEEG